LEGVLKPFEKFRFSGTRRFLLLLTRIQPGQISVRFEYFNLILKALKLGGVGLPS